MFVVTLYYIVYIYSSSSGITDYYQYSAVKEPGKNYVVAYFENERGVCVPQYLKYNDPRRIYCFLVNLYRAIIDW